MNNLIVCMRIELESPSEGHIERFEAILLQVAKLNNHDCIAKLLPLFDDDTEHDEAMFSIINVIEGFEDKTYVHSFLSEIVSFYNHSPRWARILHMRILNSPATLAAYANLLVTLSTSQRRVVSEILADIRGRNRRFIASCDSLLAIIGQAE